VEAEPDGPLWLLSGPQAPRAANQGTGPAKRAGGLSRDQIVAAAIAVADGEGPDSVSMRRIASELKVSAMSLYWHVASKEDLLVLMIDAVEGEIQIPLPSGDWRADVTRTARAYRELLLAHGWMVTFMGVRRALGPNQLVHIEHSLATLDPLGLTVRDGFNVLMSIETYYLGFALREQQELMTEREREQMGARELSAIFSSAAERLRAADRYPHVATLFEEGRLLTRDERFEYGLARLLDGIEADVRTGY
jgi:AcrR family transcriptional regulator